MLSYAVAVAKPGRGLRGEVLDLLGRDDLADLHFVATDHVSWSSADGSVGFGGWQAYPDAFGIGSHWTVDADRRLCCFSGHLWPSGGMWASGASWAQRLSERCPDPRSLPAAIEPLQGIFTAAMLGADGRGTLVTDPVSVGILYWGENDELVVLASHPRVAARVLAGSGRPLERDPLTSGWLVYLGYVVGERTGFADVRALPTGTSVELDPRWGARIRPVNPTPWVTRAALPDHDEELFDLVHQDLLASVRSVAAIPVDRRSADITGGKDSRLILSLMLEAGVTDAFEFRTTGAPHTPDAVVGARIAETFGLKHESIDTQPMADTDFRRRLLTHVFQLSGMTNAWDLKGALGVSRVVSVSGLFAEFLRTHHHGYPWPCSRDQMLERFRSWHDCDTLLLLRDDVREQYRVELEAAVTDRLDMAGFSPQDRLDSFYVHHRLRRWAGTDQSLDNSGRVFPLYSLTAMRAAFAIGPRRRHEETVHFEVMRRASSELAKLSFADVGWSDALLARYRDGASYSADPVTYEGRKAVRWQGSRLDDNRDVVTEYLLDDAANPVFDLLDRRAVERALTGKTPASIRGKIQLLGALTAAVWLGGHEHADRFGAPATVPSPPTPAEHGRSVAAPLPPGPTRPAPRGVRRAADELVQAILVSVRFRAARWRKRG